jgi:PAS domain S-box-containing protein
VARFNEAATALLRLTPSDIGRSVRDLRILTDVKDIETLCAHVVGGGAPCRRDIRDGDRYFLLRIAPYTGSDGQIGGAVLTLTNVTAFRASIDQAIYDREYTKAILNTVSEPLVVLDADLRVQTANRAFYSLFQLSREETQGVPLDNLGNDDWRTLRVWASLKAILAEHNEFQTLQIERDFPASGRRTLLLDARRVSRDGAALLLLVFQDITERTRSEAALRHSEQELADFFENATVGLHWVGPDGTILRVNQAELDLLGYTREEYLGHHIAEFHADREVITDILERLTRGETLTDYEARMRRKDGSLRSVLIDSSVLRQDGAFIHTRCFTRDITERKRLEQDLAQHAAELERLNTELQQFGYIVSHDLQEPLRTISSFVQLLAKHLHGTVDAQAAEFIKFTVEGTQRMQALITDLLAYTRVSGHRQPVAAVDGEALLARVLEDLRLMLHEQAAEVTHDPLPVVHGDAGQLGLVLQNLIGNALKFRSAAPPRIHVGARREGTQWVFWVRDNGIGIAPQHRDRIFHVFQRLHTRSEYPGTGIGLAICQKIVEQHGGRIWVESEAGQGATFFFTLPAPGTAALDGCAVRGTET